MTAELHAGLHEVRAQLIQLLKDSHGKVGFRINNHGVPVRDMVVQTLQMEAAESLEACLVRVWLRWRPMPHARIEFSAHSGRLTARLEAYENTENAADRDFQRDLAAMRQEITELARYLNREME